MAGRVIELLAELRGCGETLDCRGCKRYADEIMTLREERQWIPVTERLPAEGMRVLAATEGAFSGEAYLSCEGVWMRSYGVVWVSLVDMPVTHWMPLPDALGVSCDG